MKWTEKLKATIETFDPDFLAGIRPASAPDILELATVLRRPLPDDYREFLEFMGNLDGGLFYSERISSEIEDVISYCEDLLEAAPQHRFDRCIPIAIGVDFEGFGIELALESEPLRIVLLEEGQAGEPAFRSLPAMCFSHAFMYEQCATGGWATIEPDLYSPDRDALSRSFTDRGYLQQWFSEDNQLYFRRENRLITLVADRPGSPVIYAGGPEASAVEATLSDIASVIGTRRPEWRQRTTLPEARRYTLDAEDDARG